MGGVPGGRGVDVFADRQELRDALSVYAEHRLSGPLDVRLRPASWNLVVKALAAFYRSLTQVSDGGSGSEPA